MKTAVHRRFGMAAVAIGVVLGCSSVVQHVVEEADSGGTSGASARGEGGGALTFLDSEFSDAPVSPGGTGGTVEDDPTLAGEATRSFFTAFQIDPEAEDSAGPKFVIAADIDRDGLTDLVSGWNQSQPVQIHLQSRDIDGNLSFRTITLAGTTPIAVIAGIETGLINDDEWLDIVVLSKATGVGGFCPTSPPTEVSKLEGQIIVFFSPGDLSPSLIPDGDRWSEMILVNPLVADNPLVGIPWHNQFPGNASVSFEESQTRPEWGGFTALIVAPMDGILGDDIIVALNPAGCKQLGQEPPLNTVDLWLNPGPGLAEDPSAWGTELPWGPDEIRGQLTPTAAPVDGEAVTFTATLTGGAVVPPFGTIASGAGVFTLSDDRTELLFEVVAEGFFPCSVKVARFHRGAVGTVGPVAFDFSDTMAPTCGEFSASGVWELNPADAVDLLAGNVYVKLETELLGRAPIALMADAPQVKDIAVLDIDQDSDLDVIATYTNSISQNIRWMRNPLVAHEPGGPDGLAEVERGFCDCWRYFALGWEERPIASLDTGADIMEIADIDQDGSEDILVRSTAGQLIQWFRQPNPIPIQPEFPPDDPMPSRPDFPWPVFTLTEFSGQEPEAIGVGDVTGDGKPEVVAAAAGAVYWYDGTIGDTVYDPWFGRTVIQDNPVDTTDPAATATGSGISADASVGGAGVGVSEVDVSTHINALLIVDLDDDGKMDIVGTLDRRSGAGLSDDRLVWYRNTRTDEEEE